MNNRKIIKLIFNIEIFNSDLDDINVPPDLEIVINKYIPKSLNLYKFFYINMENRNYDDETEEDYVKKIS